MSVFSTPGPPLPPIPDDLTVAQFMLDTYHPARPLRKDGTPWLIEDGTGRKVSFEELRRRTFGLANALKMKYNIGEDDVVCVFSSNHIDYVVAVWAVHRLGGTVSTANPAYNAHELAHQLTTATTSLIISQNEFVGTAQAAAKLAGMSADCIILFSPQPSAPHPTLPNLIAEGLRFPESFFERHLDKGEAKTKLAFLCFSSGTTGKPKAVEIPHFAVIANVVQMSTHYRLTDPSIPPQKKRFRVGDVAAGVLPFFHIYGLVINVHYLLFAGVTIVVTPKFDFVGMLRNIQNYRMSVLLLVPPMMVLLCKHPEAKKYDLSSVNNIVSGAAPLSVELTQQLVQVFPQASVGQGYGMTETVTVVSVMKHTDMAGNGSVGYLLPGVRAKVVKPDGSLAKVGEPGELHVTGPSMALRYTNDEQATKETFVDGWVHTGDEVVFSETGEMYVVDRLKELIKVRGFQVAPAELEGHLLGHPAVRDVCVVPVPDDYSGEVPFAFIVPSESTDLSDTAEADRLRAALIKHVSDHKTKYKHLTGGVEFIDAIPKTAAGKLLRRLLRDQARDLAKARSRVKEKAKM